MNQNEPADSKFKPKPNRALVRWFTLGCVIILICLLSTPYLLSQMMRDSILTQVVADPDLIVVSESASFGWLTPMQVNDLKITSRDNRLHLKIGRLESDRTWWQLALDENSLGRIKLIQPGLHLDLTEDELENLLAEPVDPGGPTLMADVEQSNISLSIDGESVLELREFDFQLQISRQQDHRVLEIATQQILDRRPLTPELCAEFLRWFDPTLADVIEVDGNVSLNIEELKVLLDVPDDVCLAELVVAGSLQFHDVHAKTKTPLITGLLQLLTDSESPAADNTVQLIDNATVQFHLADGRIAHQGLAFGLKGPEGLLQMRSSGNIGFDETINLIVDVPEEFVKPELSMAAGSKEMVRINITGTLSEPIIESRKPRQ